MRPRRLLVLTAAAALAAAAVAAPVEGEVRGVRHRASDAKSKQHPPAPFTSGPQTAFPDLGGTASTTPTFELLGESFDPAKFDEISVARDGQLIAYATSVTDAGLPGTSKQIVLLPEGPGETSIRIDKVATDDDQPQVQFDSFGVRCVFRSAAGSGGAAPSNVQIHGRRVVAGETEAETIAVTSLTGDERAFDPALAARTRVRDVGGGIKVKERDARVAFVSTGDLVEGRNTANREQLFLWEEADNRFRQLTRHADDEAKISRPQIAKSGEFIAFEATADLTPEAIDPLSSSRVGNPDHVRQIFVWRAGTGVEQITWSNEDCFSPRIDAAGRFVLFSTRGDPITGGNPEGNSEIFRWKNRGPAARRLEQLTQTDAGDSVLPRPASNADVFTFLSTSRPPVAYPDAASAPAFGVGLRQATGQALLWSRGKVSRVHGFLDVENAARLALNKIPVLTGPPAPSFTGRRVFFATNDYEFNPPDGDTDTTNDDVASAFAFQVVELTRSRR